MNKDHKKLLERKRPCLENELFHCVDVTIEDLEETGWYIQRNMARWWFERKTEDGFERVIVPMWLAELVKKAENVGRENVQGEIKYALGINND